MSRANALLDDLLDDHDGKARRHRSQDDVALVNEMEEVMEVHDGKALLWATQDPLALANKVQERVLRETLTAWDVRDLEDLLLLVDRWSCGINFRLVAEMFAKGYIDGSDAWMACRNPGSLERMTLDVLDPKAPGSLDTRINRMLSAKLIMDATCSVVHARVYDATRPKRSDNPGI